MNKIAKQIREVIKNHPEMDEMTKKLLEQAYERNCDNTNISVIRAKIRENYNNGASVTTMARTLKTSTTSIYKVLDNEPLGHLLIRKLKENIDKL